MSVSRFYPGLFQMKKIMIKYIFSCVHHTSIKSNDKQIAVEAQILFMRFLMKPSGFVGIFCSLTGGILIRNRNAIS